MAVNRQQVAAERAKARLAARQDQAQRRQQQAQINAEAEASGAGGITIRDERERGGRVLAGKSLSGPSQNKSADQGDDGIEATDAAAQLAKENGIDIASIEGSGEGGRVLAKDVKAAIDAKG